VRARTYIYRTNDYIFLQFTLKEPWMEPHLLAAIISKLLVCRNKLQDNSFTVSFRAKIPYLKRHFTKSL
jgi:hypothetical protein